MSQTSNVVWHPVRLVRYDPVKHAEMFANRRTPKVVWEGEMPSEGGRYLVTTVGGFVSMDKFSIEEYGCCFATYDASAWAELPKPYEPEEKK